MAKKILVIDDEKDMRIYLSTLFSKAGYEVDTASNGSEAITKARSFRPDLVTLDVLMPKKSGVKAYHDLRSTPETRDIPVFILTGLAQQEDFFSEETAGVRKPEGIFEKPIKRDSFLEKVRETIGG